MNPYDKYLKQIEVAGKAYKYYDLPAIGQDFGWFYYFIIYSISTYFTNSKFYFFASNFPDKLPFSIRILLESAVRNCDNFQVKQEDVVKIFGWAQSQSVDEGTEVAFKPARVILQVNDKQMGIF